MGELAGIHRARNSISAWNNIRALRKLRMERDRPVRLGSQMDRERSRAMFAQTLVHQGQALPNHFCRGGVSGRGLQTRNLI